LDLLSALLLFVQSAAPFWEARYAIPAALITYPEASITWIFALGLLGNLAAVVVLLLFLEPVSIFLRERSALFESFFSWLFERTRRHSESFEHWGAFALVPFVAVPLPVTGSWTACAAAFVFGIRFRYAFSAITAGMIIAVIITTVTTLGISTLITG